MASRKKRGPVTIRPRIFWRVWLFILFEDSIIRVTTYEHYGDYVSTEKS